MTRKNSLTTSLVLWGLIYGLSLYVLPDLPPFKTLADKLDWLGAGDITQTFFLVFSLAAMWFIGKGDWRRFGFKGIHPKQLGKPLLLIVGCEIALFIVFMSITKGPGPETAAAADPGPGPDGPSGPMGMGFWQAVLSVWIYASVIEEVFYRGLCQSLLDKYRNIAFPLFRARISLPVVIYAVLFGLGHLCLLSVFGGIFLAHIIISCIVMALIAGYYREKTGSLIPAIAVHSMANVIGMMIPMLMMSLGA